MKLFKLIKTSDYVSYPIYKELVKINDSISNSITTFRDVLISTIVGVLFDKTPVSNQLLMFAKSFFPNNIIGEMAQFEGASILLSTSIGFLFYGLIKFYHFMKTRLTSNKNSKRKRDCLVDEFYKLAIPQLIEVKSMLEQVEEIETKDAKDLRKKILILLQAKHEICDLYNFIYSMHVIERGKKGVQTNDSTILISRISQCAYKNFLEEMLDLLHTIYSNLKMNCCDNAKDDMEKVLSVINSSGVFDKIQEVYEKQLSIQRQIREESRQ